MMMKKWYVDFSGYCEIEAETAEEAAEKFWEGVRSPSVNTFNDIYDIDCIEENTNDERP